jgi:hypothetical protein
VSGNTRRGTVVAPLAPSTSRLVLSPARARRAVVDAGWWPRSWDPLTELPGLVAALSERYGPIGHVMLNSGTWNGTFHRLAVGTGVIRIGWFASLDPAVLIATTRTGDQLDVLVVPPETAPEAAEVAMSAAVHPTDMRRAPDRLVLVAATAPNPAAEPDERAVWDNEGGRVSTSHSRQPQEKVTTFSA